MSESFQIALVDLREWFQKETVPLIEPLKDEGKNLLDEVKNRLDDVRENGERIFVKSDRELRKGSPKTYRCAKAANKMSKNISDKISQVVVPDDMSYENFRLLLGDLEKTLQAVEHERRVRYRRISPYFILDRRRLDIAIKRAEDLIQELRSFLFQQYVDVKAAENTLDIIDKLHQLLEKAEDVRKRKARTETRIKLLEDRTREREQKVGLIKDKAELSELSKVEQRIKDLKVKVKYNLRHLKKPFYKMQSLARRGQVALPPDEARKLDQYMQNPFEALSSEEEGYPTLKRLVQKLDDAILRGKLKLKPARLRKAREQMDDILKSDSLVDLHHHCLEATSKRKRLITSETVTTTQEKLEQFHAALKKLQNQKESIESRRRILEEEHQRILKKIETHKSEVERSIFELLDKRVQVVLTKTNNADTNI